MIKYAVIVEPRAEPNDTYVIAACPDLQQARFWMICHAQHTLKLEFDMAEVAGSNILETATHLLRVAPLQNHWG